MMYRGLFSVVAGTSGELMTLGAALDLNFALAPDTPHAWAQRSAGDESDGRGRAGTFVCTFCGQEREKLSDGGKTCAQEFRDAKFV